MSARDRKNTDTNAVVLGPNDSLVGTLVIDGNLTVHGSVEGQIRVTGDVAIESSATVQASIEGDNVTIRGQVEGNVTSMRRLQLSGSGTLQGDARVGRLVVEDGASLNGGITMGAVDASTWTSTADATESEIDADGATEYVGELAEVSAN